MAFSKRINQVIKIGLLAVVVTVISPYMLGKMGFYPNSHAADFPEVTPIPKGAAKTGAVSYADAVEKAAPGVVSIQTTKEIPNDIHPLFQDPFFRHFFGEQGFGNVPRGGSNPQKETGLGSGVIISKKGYILTNNHVIQDADTVKVELPDGRKAEAKLVGSDPATDLAVLKVELDNLPTIPIGSSKDLRVGDVVLAIGNPFGLDSTVTQGIVSATKRQSQEFNPQLDSLIQTDAPINPGNSGGGLFDAYGRLIGINMAIFTRSGGNHGIGFAIPIDMAKDILKELIETGHIIRGYLGVQLRELSKEIRDYIKYDKEQGIYVQATIHNSPAQKAGILPGDVITKIDGNAIENPRDAQRMVQRLKPGQSYAIEIYRKGDYMTFTVIIGKKDPAKSETQKG